MCGYYITMRHYWPSPLPLENTHPGLSLPESASEPKKEKGRCRNINTSGKNIPVHHSTSPKLRHLLKSMDNLFDLEVHIPSKMFRNFVQTLLDILELVLDPADVLFVNRGKAVPLQRVVIIVGGGFQLSFQRKFRTAVLELSLAQSSTRHSMLTWARTVTSMVLRTSLPSPVFGY